MKMEKKIKMEKEMKDCLICDNHGDYYDENDNYTICKECEWYNILNTKIDKVFKKMKRLEK